MSVKILSLYDGMACGMIAMQLAGVDVESYDAYEIDKYAIKTAQHNFPMIKEHGDVFDADFTQYEGVDFLIGGSPCTYWSIAQTKNRETVASGMGWELFSQYVRALHEAKPKYFIYENNKSMSKQIRASIDEAFGFEAVLINSALVSAQNRQRLYWVGRRNEDGTYSKVNVEQPEDRGILLKDVLDSAVVKDLTSNDKSFALTASYDGAVAWNTIERHQRNMVAEPVGIKHLGSLYGQHSRWGVFDEEGKAPTLTASAGMGGGHLPMVTEPVRIPEYGESDKSRPVCFSYAQQGSTQIVKNCYSNSQHYDYICEPVCMRYERSEEAKACRKAYEAHEVKHGYHELHELHPRTDGKTNTLTTVLKDNQIMEPIPTMPVKEATAKGCTEIECGDCVDLSMPNSKTRRGRNMKDKSNCMQTSNEFYQYVGYVIEFDDDGRPIKAIGKDGKEITIYEVKDGKITIKGKQYPIKLKDGYYIIRKLTVSECKRLQTVPEWYEFCWVETSKQIFGEGVKICKNAKLKDAINLLQTEKLNYAINTICGSLETEQQNLVENLSITKTNAKPKGATDNSRHLKVTALCTTSVGNGNSRLTNQKSALFVTNQSGTTVATECVLGITLNGCYTETLYLTKNENMNLMEILGVNTTKHLTESGFIELLQKKCLEESSNQKKLFIISTLINWIIAKQIYMSATTKPIFISIDSLSDWQHHSLKMELSSLKMGNIAGVSNSAAYKMLGNGWTCEVICHLINSCFKSADALPGQIGLWG